MKRNYFLLIASVSGMLAVILGAFGAHGLENHLDAKMLQRFHTGVEYQFYHSLGLLMISILYKLISSKYLHYAGYAFLLGIILFSGSLYLYVLTGNKSFAMVTPLGGLSFIVGWAFLAFSARNFTHSEKI
ncbi:DUF423 domain-containing protein [Thiothrix fructosivorans]|jgi:uncharacterized membrane protein YgdD (TMEM256/DUF423 family)|uniref:DUF423 domain-containing protein n=1 Tax=Thiothrix fructosivorans TaxID=111770 RepID=A0A8B0SFZ0_9GAMM|nr:DUF423 domain-containing protein [Thiothrix fructosivorans]MBO0614888.1 DUF423 domain-containing protein [Thiothrix fructosivorans]QTX09699.1 DUF423 domain-containing protein [Thiothrix fructosivorans]